MLWTLPAPPFVTPGTQPCPTHAASLEALSALGHHPGLGFLRKLFQWLSLTGNWEVAIGLGVPSAFFSAAQVPCWCQPASVRSLATPHTSRSSTGGNQPYIVLELLCSPRLVTGNGWTWLHKAPPKRQQKQHTWRPTSDQNRVPFNQPHKWCTQRVVSTGMRAHWCEAPSEGSAPQSCSHAVGIVSPHSQSSWESAPPSDLLKAIKVQLKQEGIHSPHNRHFWSSWQRWETVPLDHIRPPHQDWEV